MPEAARAIHPRYGFRRWPALVMLKDGQYVGAVDGLRNWDEYLASVAQLLDAASVAAADRGHPRDGGRDDRRRVRQLKRCDGKGFRR